MRKTLPTDTAARISMDSSAANTSFPEGIIFYQRKSFIVDVWLDSKWVLAQAKYTQISKSVIARI